jgi:hypothetical protein
LVRLNSGFDSSIDAPNFPMIAREAEVWLLEKDADNTAVEVKRFLIIRRWTIIAGVAGSVAAIASLIAAWPVVKEWIK